MSLLSVFSLMVKCIYIAVCVFVTPCCVVEDMDIVLHTVVPPTLPLELWSYYSCYLHRLNLQCFE